MSRLEWVLLAGLAMANLVAFQVLGLHGRIELGWGFGIGTFEVLMYSGLALATAWVPWLLMDDPREARVLMLSTWLIFASLMVVAG